MSPPMNCILRQLALLLAMMCLPILLSAKHFTLVIDAGHGGKDKGALGVHSYEKDINLAVALEFGRMVKKGIDDVDVVFTRDRDVYLTLQERVDVANSKGGNLFVSIHTNSLPLKAKNRKQIQGSATYTLGLHKTQENLEVAKRENSVISLEKDYTTTYQGFDPSSTESYIMFELCQNMHVEQSVDFATLVQREFATTGKRVNKGVRQAGFLVLARTSMPAVLVELDFICNPTQEAFLCSTSGRKKMAQSLYNAFKEYYGAISSSDDSGKNTKASKRRKPVVGRDGGESLAEEPSVRQEAVADEASATDNGKVVYKVQFLTSSKQLSDESSEFKGLSPVHCYKDKGMYKYTYGEADSEKEALSILKAVRPKFKQAFIVSFKDGKRIK